MEKQEVIKCENERCDKEATEVREYACYQCQLCKECYEELKEMEEDDEPEKGEESEWYCDRHEDEKLLHDGMGGHYCELCDENPDSDEDE